MPRSLGSMMLRCGLGYTGATYNNAKAIHIPFIYSLTDLASIELTNSAMRVLVSDAPVTRVSVSTAVTNGTFNSNLTGWTDADETGAASSWLSGGYMKLVGTGYSAAKRRQEVTVAIADRSKEHALRVVVTRGEVYFKVGSASGTDDYLSETLLSEGTHSLAFTPTGASFFVELSGYSKSSILIDSVTVEAAGVLLLTTPWTEAELPYIRWDQSADVIYVACKDNQQMKIERRSTTSWSIVKYYANDGPFRGLNTTKSTIATSALVGDVTLTASRPLFKSTHVGALFRLTSVGQNVVTTFTGADQYSDPIRVTGIDDQRIFTIAVTGTFSITHTLQRSVDEVGSWVDVWTDYTTGGTSTYDDGLDNQIIYYRIGVRAGAYTSGSSEITLSYSNGGLTGVARVTAYSSSTSVSAQVLTPFGATDATSNWEEGTWSDYRGWPSSVLLCEGRLWWFGKDRYIGSVSDGYDSFDDAVEGDSAPINKSFGSGPVANINWALTLQRLAIGADMAEHFVVSSSLDEPLTPTASSLRSPSTQGSAAVAAIKIDNSGVFVQRSGNAVFTLTYDGSTLQYSSEEISKIAPELFQEGIIKLAVQRKPDTRIHALLNDGTVAILVYDTLENVRCWVTFSTDGDVEDIEVYPATEEDAVYYTVARTIGGSTVRYREKFSKESECQLGTVHKQADSFIVFTNSPASTTISGLGHLVGEDVIVWADGVCLEDADGDIETFTVSAGGTITVPTAVTTGIAGLPYTAQFKSSKLSYASQEGTALTKPKKVDQLGVILFNAHPKGITYGRDFTNMDNLPLVIDGEEIDTDVILSNTDQTPFMFDGTWDTDSRLCLQSQAPRGATLLAAIVNLTTNG